MTFKPKPWYPIALALSAFNLVGLGDALRPVEPWHAAAHAALALAFWLWAQRLRRATRKAEQIEPLEAPLGAPLEALEAEMSRLREELTETQERLDFAERLLAQRPEPRRGPQG